MLAVATNSMLMCVESLVIFVMIRRQLPTAGARHRKPRGLQRRRGIAGPARPRFYHHRDRGDGSGDHLVWDGVRLGLRDAGLDTPGLHFGHDYLVRSFLSPRPNKRSGAFDGASGQPDAFGSLRAAPGRWRPVRHCCQTELGRRRARQILADESDQVVQWLEAEGNPDALELTGTAHC